MGLLDRLRRGSGKGLIQPAPLAWEDVPAQTASAVVVTENTALRIAAVYSAVRILAESVASLPLPVYRREGRSRERLPNDPRSALLNETPNPEQSSFELLEGLMTAALLHGNGYAYIERDSRRAPVGLWPLPPTRMRPARLENGGLVYLARPVDEREEIPLRPEDVLHVRALGTDGDVGLSPIRLARETLGAAIAAEEYGARFFSNDARPGLIVTFQGNLPAAAQEEFRQAWAAGHKGLRRSHLLGLLTNGADVKTVGLPPEDAQLVELRRFSVAEIARIFRVPPYMLADLEPGSVSYASVEQQAIDFVVHSLRPWLVRLEQAINRRLFTEQERRDGLYAGFVVDGLLRGDTAARYRAYAIGRQWGYLSVNDIRELEDMPAIDGGDVYLEPSNMRPAAGDIDAALARLLEEGT